jgi:hypothetical protein
MAAVRHNESVVGGLVIWSNLLTEVGDGLGVLHVPGVADPLVEQQRKHVRLEVSFPVPCGDAAYAGKSGVVARRRRCFLAQVRP